jgi:iron complex transport system substrate-binding protein
MPSRPYASCLSLQKAGVFSFLSKSACSKRTLFLAFGVLLQCGGCTRSRPPDAAPPGNPVAGERILYTDGIGRQVKLPRHPERIISLAPSVTEALFLLGADHRVIGVTTKCDWPEAAKRKPKVGDLLNPNFELILGAKPDLVIASTAGNDRSSVLKLADLGLPVYVTAPRSVEKIYQTVEDIGRITDCAARGEQLVARMKSRLEAVHRHLAGLAPLRAFFVTWFDPLLTPGRDTFETDALRQADVISISANIHDYYPRYSLEQVLAQDPDVIITVPYPGMSFPDLRRIAGWKDLRAVRQGRIYLLNEVFQHPSPRFVDGVEELARKLHPERFP